MPGECQLCNTSTPRLYALPPRVMQRRPTAGPACYFCFIKVTGIKPTRRLIVQSADVSGASTTG